jgi:diguanylate cyclase (GGDEF)-like protein
MSDTHDSDDFLSNPLILKNYTLLEDIGVFRHVDVLNGEIKDYESLLVGAKDVFNRINIEEIMSAAVWQISNRFLPSFIAFLWKPHQHKEGITIKGYQNYKTTEMDLVLETIAPFEPFFREHPQPVVFDVFAEQIEAAAVLKKTNPELVIPILGPQGLYGLILVGKRMLGKEYSAQEISFLEHLTDFVSQAIQNNLHYEHSVRDVKTGLFNHGYFMGRLNEEMSRVRRNKYASSLIVIDVDKFKNFNDSYGHLAGDKVLECLAETIKQSIRIEDIPSRFGGEEFTILLPATEGDSAFIVSERLRNAVATMDVPWEQPLPQVTISLGLVSFNKDTDITPEEVISRADQALYLSKEQGRNRSTAWQGPSPAAHEGGSE